LQLMTRPADAKLTPEVARELCQRAGSKAYIAGSIGSLGSEYVLGLKAVNCQSGDTLAQEQVTAASKEKVLDFLTPCKDADPDIPILKEAQNRARQAAVIAWAIFRRPSSSSSGLTLKCCNQDYTS
jgi:hypothetical protein